MRGSFKIGSEASRRFTDIKARQILRLLVFGLFFLSNGLYAQNDAGRIELTQLTEYFWEGKMEINEYQALIGQFSGELFEPAVILSASLKPSHISHGAQILDFYTDLNSQLGFLNEVSISAQTENDMKELKNNLELDMWIFERLGQFDNVTSYSFDFRKVALKMQFYRIQLKELRMKLYCLEVSKKQVLDKVEQVNGFVKRIYTSGLIDRSRKNYLTKKFGLIELMLNTLELLDKQDLPNGLLSEIFETSRLGETKNNRSLFSQGEAISTLLKGLLADIESLEIELLDNEKPLNETLKVIRARNLLRDKYYNICKSQSTNDPASVGRIEAGKLGLDITFFVGSHNTFQLIESSSKSEMVIHSSIVLKEEVSRVTGFLSDGRSSLSGARESLIELRKASKALFIELIEPFHLSEFSRLNLKTDGFLNDLPFEILLDDYNRYLFENIDVDFENYFSSDEMLIEPSVTFSIGQFDIDLLRLNALKNEARFLIGELEAKNNGFRFSLSQESNIYHLASHQQMSNYQQPSILTLDNKSFGRRKFFEFNAIPKVMVLSNCESLAGRAVSGEGNESFALRASEIGSEAIIGSLWSIEDQSSSLIMIYYYSNLKKGMNSRKSLINARKAYLLNADEFHKNPFFWASYIHSGRDFRLSVDNREQHRAILYMIVLLAGLLLLMTKSRIKISY